MSDSLVWICEAQNPQARRSKMKRMAMWIVVALMLTTLAGAAFADPGRVNPARGEEPPLKLTAEDEAVLRQAQDLAKELEISRLELRLAELKDAPQDEIAERATRMYRLRGELHALRVKNPILAEYRLRGYGQHRMGLGRRGEHGEAWGGGRGRHGMRGMGSGRGMGRGMGHGMGHKGMIGPGMGMGRGRGMGLHDEPRFGPSGVMLQGEWYEAEPFEATLLEGEMQETPAF